MKKKIITSVCLYCFICSQTLFAGWTNGSINDNKGNYYNFSTYRSNDLIEYDQYKQQQASAQNAGYAIGYAIACGVKRMTTSKRDKVIAKILKGYNFKEHHKYIAEILATDKLKNELKKPLVSLFTAYCNYRKDLDKAYLNKIHNVHKPSIAYVSWDLDLSESPSIKNKEIEEWDLDTFDKETDRNAVLEIIYEYKGNRFISDTELNDIYYSILKS